MAEEILTSQGIPPAKVAENVESNGVTIEMIEENIDQIEKQGRKEDATTLDGKFIKLEKKFFNVKDCSHAAEDTDSNPEAARKLLESQEVVKELEDELLRISDELKESESENKNLKAKLLLSSERHQKSIKKHEELDLNHKKMLEQISETEERHNSQVTTLQDALQAHEEKNMELINAKEAYDGLSLELEASRKKTTELELDLQNSSDEAGKFKELHRQSGLLAASETEKALEFERLLELAKFSAIEMENQMASLQDELKILYENIAENQKLEEMLKITSTELSTVHMELELSKSQVQVVEQRLASKEALISELTLELELARVSESKSKEDIASLENLLSSTKENFQEKVSHLEDVKLKLNEVSAKEEVKEHLNSQEAKIKLMQEELVKVYKEKEELENVVTDHTSNISQMKEFCNDLEARLQQSDENFCIADSLLSQAVAKSKEVEQKLETLEELHAESSYAVITANQKNLELEDMLQALNIAAEEAKSQLRESETRFIVAEQKSIELVQQLNLVELKAHDSQSELSELSDKLSKLHVTLKKELKEKEQLDTQVKEFQAKLTAMGSDLGKLTAQNLELELELKNFVDKCAEHEGRANTIHRHSLELEQLMQTSDSKAVYAGKKVSEIELLLEAEKCRIKELEEQISLLDKKCENAEAEFLKSSKAVSEFEAQLEVVRLKASNLEVALQASTEKEKVLTVYLKLTTEENRNLKDVSKTSNEKLFEAENLLNILRNELYISQQRLESIENDLKASRMREKEAMEKLKLAEEQLEQQSKGLDKVTARSLELELSHENLRRDTELKLHEAVANFTNRDSDAKSLLEKVKVLEDQVNSYREQLAEATEIYETVKKELDQILVKLASSENTNEDLKSMILKAEDKAEEYVSEKALLYETNAQLNIKVKDLEEKLMAAVAELTGQHSKVSEHQLAAEARLSEAEAEAELSESIQKFSLRDSEARDLHEKLKNSEALVKTYDEQAEEASLLVKSRELELEQTLLKSRDLERKFQRNSTEFEQDTEALVKANTKLTLDLVSCESKLCDLQKTLSIVLSEKDDAIEEKSIARKEIEELIQRLAYESQKLQSQVSSVMEENKLLHETYKNSKKDLQTMVVHLEEQLKEQKSNEDVLKAKLEILYTKGSQKAEMQNYLKELEEQLATAETRFKEEKELSSQMELEQDSSLKYSFEEIETKKKEILLLATQVKELERRLQLGGSKSKEKDVGGATTEPKDITIKSRDIESFTSTPSKRKSKKRSEATSAQVLSSDTQIQTSEESPLMTLKFIFGVALVSVIIGIILGKRY